MRCPRHVIVLLAALAALLALGVPLAAASGGDVVRDYSDDGVLQGRYTVAEYGDALSLLHAAQEAQYADGASVIEAARARAMAGVVEPGVDALPKERPARGRRGITAQALPPAGSASVPSPLPVPPVTQPGAGVPLPFVVLSALAMLLAVAGGCASMHRRLRRAP